MNKTNIILTVLILLLITVIGLVMYTKQERKAPVETDRQVPAQLEEDGRTEEVDFRGNGNQQAGNRESTITESSYAGSYTLNNEQYGNSTVVSVANSVRTIVTNALANHETGTFPGPGNPNAISAQDNTYAFPTSPVYTGVAEHSREPGVAINGVKFEPQTAERVTCSSSEEYEVEAIQDMINLGLDMNNAHVQPTGAYHYHGTPTGLVDSIDTEQDLVHVGFARDGHFIYYSRSDAYATSYALSTQKRTGTGCTVTGPNNPSIQISNTTPDGTFDSDWTYDASVGDLDECNGINIDGQYLYLITDTYPYIGRCLKGEFEEVVRGGGGQRGAPERGQRPGR